MSRRKFIRNTAIIGGIQLFSPLRALSISSAFFNNLSEENDRVLIMIQLNGGNDGLSTVVPMDGYDNLARLRRNILIDEKQLLPITDTLSLHPNLSGLQSLFRQDRLGIIQNVGYPDPNRSHFRSMDIWNSGSPSNKFWDSGWMGRYLDTFHAEYPDAYPNEKYPDPIVISLGNSVADNCQGKVHNYSYALNDIDEILTLEEGQLNTRADNPLDAVAFINSSVKLSNRYSKRVLDTAGRGSNIAEYNSGNILAQQLRVVARLISGGLRTKVYILKLMGFDTHALQTKEDPATGFHADLLRTLSEAVYSFQTDLDKLNISDRVMGTTYTEFGRQIKSNASFGTDHGDSSPMFLFGKSVNFSVMGNNPYIPAKVPDQTAIPMEYDFRDVYTSLLKDWFRAGDAKMEYIFGRQSAKLSLLK